VKIGERPDPRLSNAGSVGAADPHHGSHRARRAKMAVKEKIVVQDDGEGNWLMSYGDMMTLLFAFFVIISAFSTPDAAKMEKLKEETSKSMGVKYTKPFEELKSQLKQMLADSKMDKDISIVETGDGVAIVANGTLFFDSGAAELKPDAHTLISNLGDILIQEAKGFRIVVEGHTDDVPITSLRFPSNWELSSSRAGTVVRLLESKGFLHKDLRPLGLSDTEPLFPNLDESGAPIADNRARNRRIVIRIQKQLPKRLDAANGGAAASPGEKPPGA
jgi:chemotaxis protein MotB